MDSQKDQFFHYVEVRIQKALRKRKLKGRLFLVEQVDLHPNPVSLAEWRIEANYRQDIYAGNWKRLLFDTSQTLMRLLEDKILPGTKWGVAAIHENDDLNSNVFVGFYLRLLKEGKLKTLREDKNNA